MENISDLSTFLGCIDNSKDTPLRQLYDRHLATENLRNRDAQDAIGISASQLRKVLSGKTGTTERTAEQIRQFLSTPEDHWHFVFDKETGNARSHEAFISLRDTALEDASLAQSKAPPDAPAPSFDVGRFAIPLLLLGIVGVFAFSLSGKTVKDPPLAPTPPDRPCTIDLRGEMPKAITCDEFGTFSISGTSWRNKADRHNNRKA